MMSVLSSAKLKGSYVVITAATTICVAATGCRLYAAGTNRFPQITETRSDSYENDTDEEFTARIGVIALDGLEKRFPRDYKKAKEYSDEHERGELSNEELQAKLVPLMPSRPRRAMETAPPAYIRKFLLLKLRTYKELAAKSPARAYEAIAKSSNINNADLSRQTLMAIALTTKELHEHDTGKATYGEWRRFPKRNRHRFYVSC